MTDRRPSARRLLLEHWQLALTLASGLLYGYVYLTYSIFYRTFHLSLADVGLGLADLVVPTVLLLLFLLVLWVLALGMWWAIGHDIADQVRALPAVRRRRERAGRRGDGSGRQSTTTDRVLIGLVALAVAVVLGSMPVSAAVDADDAADGQPVTPSFGSLTRWSALWSATDGRSPDAVCLLYLGRDGSVGAFWDAEQERTVLLDVAGTTIYGADRPPAPVCRAPR